MLFKKRKDIVSNVSPEVSQMCATCKYASVLHSVDDLMCSKKGLVNPNYKCRHYFYNHLMKHPSRKRTLDTSNFSPEDFDI